MQFAFHGLGTILYGKRDYWPDGSYITTEWVICAYVPMFPTFSKRISHTKNSDFAVYDASGYYVYETTAPNLKQVLCVYGWFASLIATFVVYASFPKAIARLFGDEDRAAAIWLALLAIEACLPYLLRRWAWKRKMQEWRRASIGLRPPPVG